MSRKKLPKTIRQTTHEIPEPDAAGRRAAARRGASDARSGGGTAVSGSEPGGDGVLAAMRLEAPPGSVAGAPPTAGPRRTEIDAERQQLRAHQIVDRHAAYSMMGGLIPVPIANYAATTAIVVSMVKVLSELYDVPFERDRARAIVIGLAAGAMPTGLAEVTTSTLMYIVPGSYLIGLAVSSASAATFTRSIGRVFIEHFESGATSLDLPAGEGR
ncbi:MAG: YcjF family protein [Hyphomicrobiales bacterium]